MLHDPAVTAALDEEMAELLELARQHLAMDVAFVARQADGRNVFELVAAADPADRAALVGAAPPLEETYCWLLTRGRIAAVTCDTAQDPLLAAMAATEALQVGSFVGVPIHGDDGSVFGTLCCYTHEPLEEFDQRRLEVLQFVGGVLTRRLAAVRAAGGDAERARRHVRMLLDAGEPSVVLQPIYSLATGEVVSVEALARFSTAGPQEVFEAARLAGLTVELELRSARNAAELVRQLRPDLSVGVNVGLATLLSDGFVALLEDVDPARVTWELTEHEVEVDATSVGERLLEVRARGFRVALDDVGAGYAGLERMLRLQPEVIKLDRSLVTGLHGDVARTALVEATNAFAEKVGSSIVAEGIESDEDQDALVAIGVGLGQGYGLCRPVPVSRLPAGARRDLAAA